MAKYARDPIIVPLRLDYRPEYQETRIFVGDRRATFSIGDHNPRRGQETRIDALMLHDIFHHQALGLGYTPFDECLTAYLDTQWPWYDIIDKGLAKEEIRKTREDLLRSSIPAPTARQIADIRKRARRRLGYTKPKAYKPRLQKLFDEFFARPQPERPTRFTLVIDLDRRHVALQA